MKPPIITTEPSGMSSAASLGESAILIDQTPCCALAGAWERDIGSRASPAVPASIMRARKASCRAPGHRHLLGIGLAGWVSLLEGGMHRGKINDALDLREICHRHLKPLRR